MDDIRVDSEIEAIAMEIASSNDQLLSEDGPDLDEFASTQTGGDTLGMDLLVNQKKKLDMNETMGATATAIGADTIFNGMTETTPNPDLVEDDVISNVSYRKYENLKKKTPGVQNPAKYFFVIFGFLSFLVKI